MGFLSDIVRSTREAVRDPSYGRDLPPRLSERRPSLREAVERDRWVGALIVEYKRFSPGQPNPELPRRSVEEFAQMVETAGVTAYSCLATRSHFEGSPEDVSQLVNATYRPVLFKDFVVDPGQIDVAARTGASAVLLIARLATEGHLTVPLTDLSLAAHARGLEVLLEFHGKSELSEVGDVAADMYGVNVRDLDSLEIDRPTAMATIEEAVEEGLQPLLGLSGVETGDDARRFWSSGVDGILVGTAVARSPYPSELLASLRRGRPGRSL
jgi:indole-3-glycerol phosphate synthase